MVHDDRIFLVRVEVGRLHHPSVQFHTIAGGEAEEFLARHVQTCYLLHQLLIVHQSGQGLAGIVVDGDDLRGSQVGEGIDVILHALAEDGTVGTFLGRELGLASLAVNLIDSTAERTSFVAGIIIGIGLLVPT